MKFKPGDKVISKSGKTDIVVMGPGMIEYDKRPYLDASSGFVLKREGWTYQSSWKLYEEEPTKIKKLRPVKIVEPEYPDITKTIRKDLSFDEARKIQIEKNIGPAPNKPKEHVFKAGDVVRLKDYSRWSDYEMHKGESAVILKKTPMYSMFDLKIEWVDPHGQKTSNVNASNLILVKEDEDVEKPDVTDDGDGPF
jgi:hypothetical protein